MARPRVIKLNQGSISLMGFSTELANELEKHIKLFSFKEPSLTSTSQVDETFEKEEPLPEIVPALDNLPERALGVYKHAQTYNMVTVAYNPNTYQALVEKIEPALDRKDVSTKFKLAVDRRQFIL